MDYTNPFIYNPAVSYLSSLNLTGSNLYFNGSNTYQFVSDAIAAQYNNTSFVSIVVNDASSKTKLENMGEDISLLIHYFNTYHPSQSVKQNYYYDTLNTSLSGISHLTPYSYAKELENALGISFTNLSGCPTDSLYTLASSYNIYGSSRLGVMDAKKPRQDGDNTFSRKLGAKQYELTDHLGNVVATISDKKIHPQELVTPGSQNFDITMGFQPDVTGRYDYYPFGMEIQSRSGDFTNIDYTTDVNKLIYDGLLKSCNYYTTYPNNQGGQNGVEQCATAQNLYGQNYVSYYSIEDHTGSAYILEIKIRLSEVIPSLDGNGNYQIEVKLQQSRERNIVGTIGSHQAVVSSPGVGPGGNVIPFDEKLFTFNLTGDELTTAASGGKITLTLNFSQGLNGGFSPIIDVQSIRVLQNFKNTTVPLARRDEAAYTYGFGGHLRNEELSGSGNSVDMGDRWLDTRLGKTLKPDRHASNYPSLSPYSYGANNPLIFIDPDGMDIIPVHGTWSDPSTFKDLYGIRSASFNLFNDGNLSERKFEWSNGNYSSIRTEAAIELIDHVRVQMQSEDFNGKITLVGHSHGGNVSIEALNMMVEMEEFDNAELNVLTINTPVRDDYQLSEKASGRVNHVNVFDPKDPVQSNGGTNYGTLVPDRPSSIPYVTGEFGNAGRKFDESDGARNIEVDNPQGIFGDKHNSHNRTNDWLHKTRKED